MKEMDLCINMKRELTNCTPDVWSKIEQQIAQKVASELLRQLEGILSPEGTLVGEIKDSIKYSLLQSIA